MFNSNDQLKECEKSYEHLYAALAFVILQYSKDGVVHIPLSLVSELQGKKYDIITYTDEINGDVVIKVRINVNNPIISKFDQEVTKEISQKTQGLPDDWDE